MTTRITQIEEQHGRGAVLKVEGSLTLEDARLLEKVCRELRGPNGRGVRINVAGLSFLDDESAALLCRLKGLPGVELEGAHLFVMEVIERAERSGAAE
jgi:anti-anti-sigma regulatory factor